MKPCDNEYYYLIADAHLDESGNTDDFFRMLERLDTLPCNCAIVFLGDIFDLWFAVQGYETELHQRFLDWCRRARSKRSIYFIEGNHEFYILRHHPAEFSRVHASHIVCNGLKFIHGDLINTSDYLYFLLRGFIRNPFMMALIRLARPLRGDRLIRAINLFLKKNNRNYKHKCHFPEEKVSCYLKKQAQSGYNRIFAGHFHEYACRSNEHGASMAIIPAFFLRHEIGCYKRSTDQLEIGPWEQLLDSRME